MNVSVVILAVTLVTAVSGLICQFPHCDTVKCDPVPENCTGTVQTGGGYCGCCMACFTYIAEGDPCEVKDALDAILHPLTETCATGLVCDHVTRICKQDPWNSIG